ncbi:MAG: molybdopterin-dependent oxidoreductase [Dehalococcoidia bacterium]
MATITIDGRSVAAMDGATLLEVCKQAGVYISSLCYIDGLPPYAGCRMCLVEIEGMRGLQLSCTTKVTDGMTVRTTTSEVGDARKQVLSIILANHSDRCLTCHRREHCHPGDICLRDGVVTHRCLTCPKNYRCELQATCEVVGMSLYEPWEGEARSFYAVEEHPPADQGNPFLEFDPKMCIICTRCVRACDEIRHTGAITLAGRGFSSRIAFGAGGPVHDSNCDFCGACIDVCPTATLLEHPHKWTSKPEHWVPTVCSYCSVGCTIDLGVKDGRGVMVRPSTANPVSHDQICVRGRFHYDALRKRDYLARASVRRGDLLAPASWDQAVTTAVEGLLTIKRQHGADAIGFLGGPLNSNEELYLLQRLARGVIGTNNLDFSAGAVAARIGEAIKAALGTEVLPADVTSVAKATHLLVVGDDLEASHPVASLRVKDAVTYNQAQLITVSERWNELVDFTDAWLRPAPGGSASVLAALTQALLGDASLGASLASAGVLGLERVSGQPSAQMQGLPYFDEALSILRDAITRGSDARLAIIVAPTWVGAWSNSAIARAAANLAIVTGGPVRAPAAFFYLPTDVNVIGLRDMGVTPDLLPGYHPLSDGPFRDQLSQLWRAPIPQTAGLDFRGMLRAAKEGKLKALVVMGDDPFLRAANSAEIRAALERLDLLVVIDSVLTETAQLAHVILPDADVYGKEGTYTPADRRVLKRLRATDPAGDAHPAWATLIDLGERLVRGQQGSMSFAFSGPADVMDEIATLLPLYAHAHYADLVLGDRAETLNGAVPAKVSLQSAGAGPEGQPAQAGSFSLLSGRTLYTSLEAASLHKQDADKLHREDKVEISLTDADRLGIHEGDSVQLTTELGQVALPAHLTEGVQAGTVFVSELYAGGAINALLNAEEEKGLVPIVQLSSGVPA